MRNFLPTRFTKPSGWLAASLVIFLFGSTSIKAQLSGAYTIDASSPASSTNYTSFSAAAADLVTNGVSGAVTFTVAAGSYTDTVYLPAITGASMTNTITFDGVDSATTSLSYNSSAVVQKAVILMDGADYVSFKNLTISHSGTTDAWGIRMQNDNDNFSVDACHFDMAVVSSTSADVTAIGGVGSATSSFTETDAGDNISISNSVFHDGQYGVHFETLAYADTGISVTNCEFLNNYYRGYMSDNVRNQTINDCKFTEAAYGFHYSIALYDALDFEVNRNEIYSSYYGIYISDGNFNADGTPSGTSNITNNMVVVSSGGQEALYADDFESCNVFYNTFVTNGTSTGAYGAYFNDFYNVDVRNNVFYGSSNYAVYFSDNTVTAGTSNGVITVDYNGYYTSGGANIAYDGGVQADLTAWQTASAGNNTNSVVGDPIFNSITADLHVSGPLLDGAATPIGAITVDIDGDTRNATTPDIGADEFTPASCLPASGLGLVTAYADSAKVNWVDNNGPSSSFTIEYGASGFTPGSGTTVSGITDTSYTITGLSGQTTYDFYVTADCGTGGTAAQAGPASFTTDCSAIIPPSLEDFSAGWPPSACWEEGDGGDPTTGPNTLGTGAWGTDGFGNNGTSGAVRINLWNTGDMDWILSPAYDLGSTGTMQVEFDFGVFAYAGTTPTQLGSDDQVQLLISTDFGATWTNLATYDNTYVTAATGNHEVASLAAYTGVVKFAIWATEGSVDDPEDNDIFVDNFQVRVAPACAASSGLQAFNITATSADLTWTAGDGANWGVEYGPAGFTPGTGTSINATNDTISISGLMANTNYEFYVTDSCGTSGTSTQSGPASFRTSLQGPRTISCTSGTLGALLSEEFDNTTSFTGDIGAGNGSWLYDNNYTGSSSTGPSGPQSGTHYIYVETSTGGPDSASMVSPAIDLSAASQNVELSFWLHAYGANIGVLKVGVSTSATGPFTNVFTYGPGELQTDELDPWQQVGVNLDAYLNQTIYVEFRYIRGTSFYGDLAIDLVEVQSCLSCLTPSNLTASNITATDADITWTSGVSNLGSTVEYGPAGFTPGTGTTMTTTMDSVRLSGLMPATMYDVYVTDSCGAGDISSSAGPISFTTLCPTSFTAPYSTDFEGVSLGNQASYENCWFTYTSSNPRWEAEDATTGSNENSTGTGPLVDNTVGVGGTYMYFETSGGTTGDTNMLYSPQIDISTLTTPMVRFYYHMHGSAMGTLKLVAEDASGNRTVLDSIVGQQQSNQADPWNERLVLLSLPSGTYRFLFEGVRGTSFTSDMSIDDFSVEEAPSCFPSSGLSVTATADVSATVAWTAGTGSSWIIEYGPAGFTPGTGTVVNTTSNPYTITGLTASTAYDFYVTDSCGTNGTAQTAGPGSFTTAACPASEQCVFRADLSDSFGDGWNGGAVSVYQNGVLVGQLGTGFTNGSSFTDSIVLCDGLPTTVTLNPAGSWPSEIGLVLLNPKGDTAGVHIASGSVGTGDTLFSFNASCTRCLPFTAPFYESFETSSPSVDCWSNVYVADTRDWTIGSGSSGGVITSAYAGSQNAVFVSASGGPDTTLFVSPRIDLSAMISPQLSFWYAQEEWFGDQNVTNVYYRASETDPWTFLFGDSQNRNAWTQAIVSLPNASSTYQIAIMGVNNWGRANVVDSLAITDAANICGKPDSVQASNVTATSADISWVSGTNQSSSWIEYGPAGFAPGTGTIVNPATSATTLSGLMPGTLYEACVYDICSSLGDTSDAECVSFATLCAPITNYPYMEDFDNGVIPPCYSETSTATGYTWRIDNGGTPSSATGPAVDHTTGTATGYYMYVEASSPAAQGDSAFLWTAEFDLTSLTNPEVVYYYHMYGADIVNLDLQAFDRTSSTWVSINNIVGQQQTSNSAAWGEARVNLSTYGTDTALQLRLLSVRGASFNGDAAVDDIIVRETPPCVDPANLAVVTAGASSVTLSWDSDTNIVASTVQYGAPGFALGTGTNVAATPGGFTVTGLAGTTCYDFYVMDSCSAGTNWVGPVTACTIATCSVSSTPSSTTNDTTDCDGGPTNLSGTSSTSNGLVWLSGGQAVNTGDTYLTDSVAFTTAYDVSEFVTTNSVAIGPLTNIATSGYGNFTNGQWITVDDTVHIDSMTVNHTNDVTAFVQVWDAAITAVIQRGDTFSTPAGVTGDFRVPVNMVLTPGVYFMNVDFLSGAGSLFRATGGASYPYTVAGLMSIDSTNFADQSRIYYTFDMSISKACIGPSIPAYAVVPGANAGMTDTVTVCSTDNAVNLAAFLGVHDGGGTWVDVDGTNALTDSIFDASAVTAGAAYNFSYIVGGVSGCPGDTAHLNVNVEAAPFAGVDTTANACAGGGILILRNYITGNRFQGTWVDLDNSGALGATGSFNTNNATPGVYRAAYILAGTVCDPDTAIVTVDVDGPVSAGIAVSDTACDDETMVDLNTYLDPSATAGGTWTDLSGTGALSANIFDATAVASGASYDFQYKVSSNCGDDSVVVSLLVDDCGVGLNDLSTGFINIYPNPTRGIINIDDENVEGNIQVEVYSASGALVISEIYTEHQEIRLDISEYAVGIYTVKVSSSKGLDVKRIMKN